MKSRLRTIPPSIAVDASSSTPLYRQLYEAYREAILSGQLGRGAQLPSTREVAAELGISRNTVLNAFEQLLAEGYTRGEVGAGTFVDTAFSYPRDRSPNSNRQTTSSFESPLSKEAIRIANTPHIEAALPAIPFRTGLPALDCFPVVLWSRIVAAASRAATVADMNYSDPQGHSRFRCAIAEYLRQFRAVKCEPEQICIVSGSQQGLQLIARVMVNDGDAIWVENPGYPGARAAFSAVGAELIPVPVDEEGIQVPSSQGAQRKAKLVYVTPSHQFPLGFTMSLARRLQLIDLCQQNNTWIVEDDYDSEFRHAGRPLSSLQGLAPDRVIYVGTFSKVMFPALRLGYIVVPLGLVEAFSKSRRAADFCPPFINQAAMATFILEGYFARHLRRMRALYVQRHTAIVEEIERQPGLPCSTSQGPTQGG